MAETVNVKKITALPADTSVVDNDLFVVGDASGDTLKKMTFARLVLGMFSKLTASAQSGTLATTTEGITLSWKLIPSIGLLRIIIGGTTSAEISTASAYYTIGTVSAVASIIATRQLKYVSYGARYRGQLNITTSGAVQLGYSRSEEDNAAANIPSGQSIYINETFLII